MALGAERVSVYRLILKDAGGLIGLGLVMGVLGSISAAHLMESQLFEVSSWDVPTLGAVALVLSLSALLASFIPARRAASVNPLEALRAE
jgi:ABC-type antimicrobial peptide transport system permease subunit